jgi:WhiB family redox-sensing transcriptional regulator
MAEANCKGLDPEMFFPKRDDPLSVMQGALTVCGSCTVKEHCLSWAVQHNERDGVWGNTTGRQRRKMRSELVDQGVVCRCVACDKEFMGNPHALLCSEECRTERRRETRRRYIAGKVAS